jgi:tetratricopeptide (TPR) repeat protein
MTHLPDFWRSGVRVLALTMACAAATVAPAQTVTPTSPVTTPTSSALDGALFYQLLLGELAVRAGESDEGFQRTLAAARKTNDARLYQRAVEIALQARNGDAAVLAVRAWQVAQPMSRPANRYLLQILVALNRLPESAEPLKKELDLAPAEELSAVLAVIPLQYQRVIDKKLAAQVVQTALSGQLEQGNTAAPAWVTVGRLRLAAGDVAGALDAAKRAQAADAKAEGPAVLALEIMDPKQPQAEDIVRTYLAAEPLPLVRMGYARALLDAQRYAEASAQLQKLSVDKPDFADAWLVLGTLQVQDNQLAAADASLKRYLQLTQDQAGTQERRRGQTQAFLSLAQVAEKQRDFPAAQAWLERIENAQDMVGAQNRRASILARQGRLDDARKLIQALPERSPEDTRTKLFAEVQLLRDNKQLKPAYDLLAQAAAKEPGDTDLLYEQAMVAEKLRNFDDMEKLLRQVIAAKPESHHAYNALGYSMADRNVRLPEAKQLIQKAVDFAPGDPFIADSLAWVEFRLGNKSEALRILEAAYKTRPDAEIAAHLGEVLWSVGQRERAIAVWKEGLLQASDNETLQETLKRLRVKL